ncbi:MAG: tryptophan synthase subunit beta [Burkholderiales bacterium]|nr:tryptophan synthase subunit beta [Burkholderiales bacterium]
MLIKICGITTPEMARKVAASGADYIGLLFTSHSPRQINLDTAKQICTVLKDYPTQVVGVFFDETLEQIKAIDAKLNLDLIQLHGDLPRASVNEFANKPIIYVADGKALPSCLNPAKDFVLYEKITPPTQSEFRFFIAGGLDQSNVLERIAATTPDGVDLSSGVESSRGVKDFGKIRDFLALLRPTYYGAYGGMFVPELLIEPLHDLTKAYHEIALADEFQHEYLDLLKNFVGRPTALTEVKNFAAAIGLKHVYLKREDLTHTGAHKINNALGQCLLAKKMGKTRIVAETGAGQHGVATATACAMLGLECVVYMGQVDVERQAPNVAKMRLLGAKVVPVTDGSATLKDAVNEALRDWAASYEATHYCLGTALGPYPFPQICARFQAVIGNEAKAQFEQRTQRQPDLVIACVGGGSNAIGIFQAFIPDEKVKLVGVEAGGYGLGVGENAARFQSGRLGVLHGNRTYVLQTSDGQIADTHSISAGLDYAAVGPQHSDLYSIGRAEYDVASDQEALAAFQLLTRSEGIIPALESSHALGYLMRIAKDLPKDIYVLVNLSGRGDKDLPGLIERGLVNVTN